MIRVSQASAKVKTQPTKTRYVPITKQPKYSTRMWESWSLYSFYNKWYYNVIIKLIMVNKYNKILQQIRHSSDPGLPIVDPLWTIWVPKKEETSLNSAFELLHILTANWSARTWIGKGHCRLNFCIWWPILLLLIFVCLFHFYDQIYYCQLGCYLKRKVNSNVPPSWQ